MLDPILIAAAIGVFVSPVAGRGLQRGLERVSERRRRRAVWLLIGLAVAATVLAELLPEGLLTEAVFIFLLGAVPGIVVYMLSGTALASAVVSLVPLYFGVGAQTLGLGLHAPEVALDRAVGLEPAWMLVYGSLLVFLLLPVFVVRDGELFRRAMKTYLVTLSVAYVGFVFYPTAGPRPSDVPGDGFAAWCLRLQYSLDWRYNCFPSLHVANSFVSALIAYRVNRTVGFLAVLWAALIGVSTLYTKQHYFVDVIAGTLLALMAYGLFLRGYPREAVSERDRSVAPLRALAVVGIYGFQIAGLWAAYHFRLNVL